MRIIVHIKFLFLAILFSSISSLVKSEVPSHCSELYGCQVDDPQEAIVNNSMRVKNLNCLMQEWRTVKSYILKVSCFIRQTLTNGLSMSYTEDLQFCRNV